MTYRLIRRQSGPAPDAVLAGIGRAGEGVR